MSDAPDDTRQAGGPPEARSRPIRFSLIWLIPVVVLAIGGYLAWTTISRQGPEITIQFDNADGLTNGQTQIKQKAVGLGTVQSIELSHDLQHVDVRVQMSAQSAPLLTNHAKFWVVRPRLSGANISGLETLVSGAFIAIDPGPPGGTSETKFTGLDSPPGVRSDDPGSIFTLSTGSLGSVGEDSPIFFRDVTVGEILGYKMPADGRGPITVQAFIKAPYDQFLRRDTRFWDVSGVTIDLNGGNLHFEVESLQALISGGVAFGLPVQRRDKEAPRATSRDVFELYPNKDAADNAGYRQRIHYVTYLRSSVRGLGVGSPVEMFGLQVGTVTDVKLQINQETGDSVVRVAMEVEPERVLPEQQPHHDSPRGVTQALVDRGMRASVDTANFVTGSSVISLSFVPKAPRAMVMDEGDAIVVPSQPGGLSGITDSLATVSAKLAALPIEQIGDNLSELLAHADATVGGPEVKQALVQLNRTLASLDRLTSHADQGLDPLLQRLPAISDQLQQAVANANTALAAYGGNSDFHGQLQRTLDQVDGTARSIRSLVDYLKNHPSSLIFGRSHP